MLKPLKLEMNIAAWKFFGIKAHRVCYSCFLNKPNKCFRKLRDREIGKLRGNIYNSSSKSQDELYRWFESFNEYVIRPDADDYKGPFDFVNLLGFIILVQL